VAAGETRRNRLKVQGEHGRISMAFLPKTIAPLTEAWTPTVAFFYLLAYLEQRA
jgi:hypothetical protein